MKIISLSIDHLTLDFDLKRNYTVSEHELKTYTSTQTRQVKKYQNEIQVQNRNKQISKRSRYL